MFGIASLHQMISPILSLIIIPAISAITYSTDGTCGGINKLTCPSSLPCCSQYGYCGNTDAYCKNGCQTIFGTCSPTITPPPPQRTPVADWQSCNPSTDTCASTGFTCYAAPADVAAGKTTCRPTAKAAPVWKVSAANEACSAQSLTSCASTLCCSQYGFCGATSAYCDSGCQALNGGFCNPPNRDDIQSYQVHKLTASDSPPSLNGSMLSSVWSKAAWTPYFIDLMGTVNPNPSLQTRAKLLWDDNYLYIGMYLNESDVWTDITQQNSAVFQQNDIEFFIDSSGQGINYLEYEVNALKTTWTLTLNKPYSQGGQATTVSIPNMKYGVSIAGTVNNPNDKDKGWGVEVAIPFSYLQTLNPTVGHYPPRLNEQWRLQIMRVQWPFIVTNGKYAKQSNDFSTAMNWVWTAQGSPTVHDPSKWGYLNFVA